MRVTRGRYIVRNWFRSGKRLHDELDQRQIKCPIGILMFPNEFELRSRGSIGYDDQFIRSLKQFQWRFVTQRVHLDRIYSSFHVVD